MIPKQPKHAFDPADASNFRQAFRELGYEGGDAVGALIDTWPDYVVLMDFEGTVRCANARSIDVLGWRPEDIVGRPAADFVPAEEHLAMQETVEHLRAGDQIPLYERRFVDRTGNERTVEISASVLRDADAQPVGLLSIIRDITERRRAEVFIRRLVEGASVAVGADYLDSFSLALVQAFGVTAAGIVRFDASSGTLKKGAYAVAGKLMTGYPPVDGHTPHHDAIIAGLTQIESGARALYPEDGELDRLGIESYTGLPLRSRRGVLLGVLFLMDKRPALLDVEQWALRAFADRAVLELEHIEQRRWVEREARRRKRLLRHVPAAFYERAPDPDQPPDYLGSDVAHISGYEASRWERPLKQWLELVDDRDRDRVGTTIVAALASRTPYRVEFRVLGEDGETRWIRDEATPVLEDGRDLYAGVLLDVTAQRLFQEQVANTRRLESIGFLAAGVAHDFNNLLMTSIGQLSLAKADQDDGLDVGDRLAEIEKALVRAAGLTRQLQSLSKGGDPIRRSCDLRETIHRTVRFATEGTQVRSHFDFQEGLWPCSADEGQMAQVVENLILNAVQAMPDGGDLVIAARNEEFDAVGSIPLGVGRYVRFTVADSGEGMEPSVIDQIFDPYFSTKEKGFGLGLASSHAIVRRHGGHLHARSEPGQGTTMTFYLMAGEESELPDMLQGPSQRATTSNRALVLDDDPAVQAVVVKMLRRLGLEATTASTGEEAIECVRADRDSDRVIDFALLDLTIREGLGGRQAAREIRSIAPDLPLIATSGYSEDPVMSSFREYGFDDSIPKPYTMDQLRQLIARL